MIRALACAEPGQPLQPLEYAAEPLGPGDVRVRVECCGVCGSDVHLLDDAHGHAVYPIVPGHEIVGAVSEVGADVRALAVGDRVGVGFYKGNCDACDSCAAGLTQHCAAGEFTCEGGARGGWSSEVRVQARHAHKLPEALASAEAAPLLCAGVAVFSPLLRAGLRPGASVCVLGMGGLGHLAVQFASKSGYRVTVATRAADKEEDARRLGAADFLCLAGADDDAAAAAPPAAAFDLVLVTSTGHPDELAWIQALRPRGEICFVGLPPAALSVDVLQLLIRGAKISASAGGSRDDMRRMLAFAAEQGVRPLVETMPLADVNEALARVRGGGVRYRMVLTV